MKAGRWENVNNSNTIPLSRSRLLSKNVKIRICKHEKVKEKGKAIPVTGRGSL
jgi:hypothetical protein